MTQPVRVSPSLLSCDFANLANEVRKSEDSGADWHHIDVMDGHFVPNLTIGPIVVEKIKAVASCPLDVHLMIESPKKWAKEYADAGADILSFHYEASREDFAETLDAFKQTGCQTGVAINPDCPIEVLQDHLIDIDLVLVMSVFPGFSGQKFIPDVLQKVRQLKAWGFEGDLEMDGGITDVTSVSCREAGANALVSGSYLFGAQDMSAAMNKLRG